MKVSLIVSDIDGTILPAGCGQDGKRSDGPGVSYRITCNNGNQRTLRNP